VKEFTEGRDKDHGSCTDIYGGPTLVVTAYEGGFINIYQWIDHYDYETDILT
jgi:hypothetical protein